MLSAKDFKVGEIIINNHNGDEFFHHYGMITEIMSNFLTVKFTHGVYGSVRNLIPSHGEVEKLAR